MAGWSELMSGGTEHYLKGELPDAVHVFRETVAEAKRLFAEADARHLLSLSMLANCLALTGEEVEAEALYRQQLAIREAAELEADTDLAECVEGLARCMRARGDAAAADGLEARARAVRAQLGRDNNG